MKIKRILAVAMATTLVFGSTITAFAEGEGTSEGTGSYEGGEMQYPTLSVTLPTIPAGTYDYIADPNGLIAATSAAHYPNSDFSGGTTGVFFLTTPKTDAEGSKNIYTNKSAAQTLTNQNAQDIDVTVKLEQKTAGAEGIAYSDSATFENTDKDKKLYLAVTDDAAQDPKVSALSATSAATLTTTVAGKPSNYKPSWTSEGGYKYALKTKAENNDTDLTWNSCSFILTGALNKNATWEDGLTFPTIKVTWSYAEHQDNAAPTIATKTYNYDREESLPVTLSLGTGDLAATGVSSVAWATTSDGEYTTWASNSGKYTVSGTTLTFASGTFGTRKVNDHMFIKVTFNDSASTAVVLDLTITK